MSVLGIVPTFLRRPQDLRLLEACLTSAVATTEPGELELLVVDDGSPSPELLAELAHLVDHVNAGLESCRLVRRSSNEGFSRTVNVGLAEARDTARDALLINADVEFWAPGWLHALTYRVRESPGPIVVGGRLIYPNGLIQHGGIFFSGMVRVFEHRWKYAPLNLAEALVPTAVAVTGALQLISADALQHVGLYDEDFRLGWEDVDYCLRVFQAGGRCVYEPAALAVHHESMFRGDPSPRIAEWQAQSWVHFRRKWAGVDFGQWVSDRV